MTDPPTDPIYVGYLPTPRADRRFLRLAVPAILWALCAIAALLAITYAPAGDAIWNTDDTVTLEGTLIANPYPAIITLTDDVRSTTFLVEPGKLGAPESITWGQGRVSGFVLSRDARRVLELVPDALERNTNRFAFPPFTPEPLGPATLTGEIVDYKCYLGAMKPGHGRTHRACAILCISGGIPPALVTTNPDRSRNYYILRSPQQTRLNDDVLPFVATPVTIRGNVVREGDVLYLETTADDITPN